MKSSKNSKSKIKNCLGHKDHDETKKEGLTDKVGESLYVCPMHPEVTRKEPGDCPKCGMKLEKHNHGGKHAGMEETFKRRFFIALPLSIIVLALSPKIQGWFGQSPGSFLVTS